MASAATEPAAGPPSGNYPANIAAQLAVARAAELGRRGDYERAIQLLDGVEPSVHVLDLRARIDVQRGRATDARKWWIAALERDPSHEGAKSGLRWLDKATGHASDARRVRTWLGAGFGAAVVVVLVIVPYWAAADLRRSLEQRIKDSESVLVAKLAASLPRPVPKPIVANTVIAKPSLPVLSAPRGVEITEQSGTLVAIFPDGLFRSGVAFAPRAKEPLTALGLALEPYTDAIEILVIGCADNSPIRPGTGYFDNGALGMARAFAVARHLSRVTRLPMSMFRLRSQGGEPGPLKDNPEDLRNRTVVVQIGLRDDRGGDASLSFGGFRH